jgi:hypothetical protein
MRICVPDVLIEVETKKFRSLFIPFKLNKILVYRNIMGI